MVCLLNTVLIVHAIVFFWFTCTGTKIAVLVPSFLFLCQRLIVNSIIKFVLINCLSIKFFSQIYETLKNILEHSTFCK